jgi:DNA-binding NarL/FixJ family response regulator
MFGAAEALHEAIGMPLLPADRAIFDPFVREARTRIGKDDFDRAWSAGRQLLAEGLEAVIDYALDSDAVPDKKTGTTSPCGLTVREVEVLRLVAQGLTDAQVAEQLVISPRTVNAHLTSIYSKMGVNSRAAATRFAVEEGLV